MGWDTVAVVREPKRAGEVAASRLTPEDLDGVDLFIHSAAVRHRYGASVSAYRNSNYELPIALAKMATGRVGRFVFVSSVGVYGFPQNLPITERHPYAPVTLYSQTKVDAEIALRKLPGLPLTIIRPTIIYGPGDTNGMLDKLAAMLRARRYLLVGNGQNVLHHTYIDDVVDGTFGLATDARGLGEDFIVAGPETITLARLSELVAARVGAKVPRIHVPMPFARAVAAAVDLAAYRGIAWETKEPPINGEKLDIMGAPVSFDPGKARAAGYVPKVGYEEGIARTIA